MAQEKEIGQDPTMWEQRWREHVAAWRASGQTQQAFCSAHGLSVSSLSRWKGKLAQRDQRRAERAGLQTTGVVSCESELVSWTEVRWPAAGVEAQASSEGSGFEVILPRGWSVRLGPRFEAEAFRRLLAVLEERSC